MAITKLGPWPGQLFFNGLIRDSFGATLFAGIMLYIYLAPLLVISEMVMSKFKDQEKVNPKLYENELLVREDPDADVWLYEYNGPQWTCFVFFAVIATQGYRMHQAFKVAKRARKRLYGK